MDKEKPHNFDRLTRLLAYYQEIVDSLTPAQAC